jgi:hypothetical protein
VDGKLGPCTYQALLDHLNAPAAPAPAPVPVAPPVADVAPVAPTAGTLPLPARPADAPTGSQFLKNTARLGRADREKAILAQVLAGNVPDFERQLKEVHVETRTHDGRRVSGTLRVLPDYLAIGSNEDHVRIPMSPLTAQAIADRLGCILPTRKMVDAIYKQADVKLQPRPLPAGPQMMSNDYYARHQELVNAQLADQPLGALVAGDKKDVVISNMLRWHPGRVAIYGWHQAEGKPIQGLSTVHEESYADYSHGIRLVAGTMTVDGQEMAVADVLKDPSLAELLSDEGAIGTPRYPTR